MTQETDWIVAVREKIEDTRSHGEVALKRAKKRNTLPELEEGHIADWRLHQLTDLERSIYDIAKAEALEFACEHIEAALPDQ